MIRRGPETKEGREFVVTGAKLRLRGHPFTLTVATRSARRRGAATIRRVSPSCAGPSAACRERSTTRSTRTRSPLHVPGTNLHSDKKPQNHSKDESIATRHASHVEKSKYNDEA